MFFSVIFNRCYVQAQWSMDCGAGPYEVSLTDSPSISLDYSIKIWFILALPINAYSQIISRPSKSFAPLPVYTCVNGTAFIGGTVHANFKTLTCLFMIQNRAMSDVPFDCNNKQCLPRWEIVDQSSSILSSLLRLPIIAFSICVWRPWARIPSSTAN